MSTIGNGINGIGPGQTSSKSKAAHGKTADTSQKGAFANAVASLQGKAGDGESNRKGGRISIAETSRTPIQTEQGADMTRKTGRQDLTALAQVLQEASVESPSNEQMTPFEEQQGSRTEETGLWVRETRNEDPEMGKVAMPTDEQPKIWRNVTGLGETRAADERIVADQPRAAGERIVADQPHAADERTIGDQPRAAGERIVAAQPRAVGERIIADQPRAAGEQNTPGQTRIGDKSSTLEQLSAAVQHGVVGELKASNTSHVADERVVLVRETVKTGKDVEDARGADEIAQDVPAKTDVGNLLEMLAAPAVIPHAVVNGAAAQATVSGAIQDMKVKLGETALPKVEMQLAATAGAQKGANTDATVPLDMADAGEMPEPDTDQLFRLIRADGKGRDLDMSISGTGERTSLRDASQTAAAKVETVTVLDSRRYIGLAPTGNAGAVTTAIAQDPNWAASLGSTNGLSHSEAAVTGKVVNTLKIQMKPIDLGTVTATLRLHGDALVVSLQVETGEAYRQLSDDQDAIVKALRGQGFAVDQVSVQLSPVDRGNGTQQQGDGQTSQQQQFSSQPQAREGGSGRQGGNGDGTRTFAGEGTSHDGNTSENASGPAGGQPVRSGGVYL